MGRVWIEFIKVISVVIISFAWFGVVIPFLINTPDNLVVSAGFIAYPVGALSVLTLIVLMWKKSLVRLKDLVKESFL